MLNDELGLRLESRVSGRQVGYGLKPIVEDDNC